VVGLMFLINENCWSAGLGTSTMVVVVCRRKEDREIERARLSWYTKMLLIIYTNTHTTMLL
jgi:hypothetical protein